MASITDWGFLDGCFDGNIRPTDIDGIVHINGRFLLLEAKTMERIPHAQQRMFAAMAASGLFTVMVLFGWTNNPKKLRIIAHNGERVVTVEQRADVDVVRARVRAWYEYVRRLPPPLFLRDHSFQCN